MKRNDVESVIIKSFDYFKYKLGDEIDLGDLYELSNYIWWSIKDYQDMEAKTRCIYRITKTSLSELVTKGEQTFKDMEGNTIILKFEDDDEPPCILESGGIYLCKEFFKASIAEKEKPYLKKKERDSRLDNKQKQLDEYVQQTSHKKSDNKCEENKDDM